ncbi:nitrogen regulation protein NR(II) [Pseudomonas sp. F1_0610]|uniref:nitrogen regulation protein NR(II) n=1 Tax=Pseudomonas sp. F1_0610 TaxID=3114284 RepID=UPI0039C03478
MQNVPHPLLLLENLSTAVLLTTSTLDIAYMNLAAEMLLETSKSRCVGQAINLLFVSNPLSLDDFQQAYSEGNAVIRREAILHTPFDKQLVVDYSVSPFSDQQATYLLIELYPRDRLFRISREEAQQAQHESARQLVKSLAHEIKNPLGGIRGAAQLLARELPNQELKDYTDVIITETDRLTNLVDRLLGTDKRLQLSSLNIHQVLEYVCQIINAETQHYLTIERDYDPSIPELHGDYEQLIQAIINVVRNAMQALEQQPNGFIKIRTRTLRQHTINGQLHRLVCKVDVIDNGPGIAGDLKDTIFYPMVTGRAQGTGLGLAIAQTIMRQHNGIIELDTESEHTCFSLLLPIAHGVPCL